MAERARAHARRSYCCSCGKVVWGNGAKAQHFTMHDRRDDGHGWISEEEYFALHATVARANARKAEET